MSDEKKPETATLPELLLKGLRSRFSAEVDRSLTSLPIGATTPVVWAVLRDWGRPGDQQQSVKFEEALERFFDGKSRPEKFGEYDLRMAAGWTPKGPLKINGRMVEKPETVTNLLAVFVRDGKGQIELLDPSVKVHSLGELKNLPEALWGKGGSSADERWKKTAGTFVEVQLAAAVATLGVGATVKGLDVLGSKVPKLAKFTETAVDLTRQSQRAIAPVSGLTAVGGVSQVVGAFSQSGYFTPAAIQRVIDGVTDTLSDPKKLTAQTLRNNLNSALHDYSFKEGSSAKQIYIPSLRAGDDPFKRFDSLLGGGVEGYKKPTNPWQEWSHESRIPVGDIRGALKEDARFQKTFLDVAAKALSGGQLSDAEIFVLRVKINTGEHFSNLLGKEGGASGLKYSEEEKQDTLKRLRLELKDDLVSAFMGGRSLNLALASGLSVNKVKDGNAEFYALRDKAKPTDPILLQFVAEEVPRAEKAGRVRAGEKYPVSSGHIVELAPSP